MVVVSSVLIAFVSIEFEAIVAIDIDVIFTGVMLDVVTTLFILLALAAAFCA